MKKHKKYNFHKIKKINNRLIMNNNNLLIKKLKIMKFLFRILSLSIILISNMNMGILKMEANNFKMIINKNQFKVNNYNKDLIILINNNINNQ